MDLLTYLLTSSGRQPNFAALNRGRRLYSAGRPSGWALAHISSLNDCFTGMEMSTFLQHSWLFPCCCVRIDFEAFCKKTAWELSAFLHFFLPLWISGNFSIS